MIAGVATKVGILGRELLCQKCCCPQKLTYCGSQSSKSKEPASGKDTKEKEEAAKEQVQVPAPPETAPPPEIELVPRVMAASPPPPPIAAFIPAISLVVPPPPAEPASGDKRYAAPLPRVEFINLEDVGYVHKFRWGAYWIHVSPCLLLS